MNREPINSMSLKSVGYDPETRILEIEFNSGEVHQYLDVPENVYKGLMAASSYGQYFHSQIRVVYRYRVYKDA